MLTFFFVKVRFMQTLTTTYSILPQIEQTSDLTVLNNVYTPIVAMCPGIFALVPVVSLLTQKSTNVPEFL